MRCLVLGSSGQIGSSFCLVISGIINMKVFEFDILNQQEQDLRINNALLEEYLRKSDFLFFSAFDIGGSNYIRKYQNTYEFLENNSKIMINTFDVLKRYKTPFSFRI